MLKWYIQKSQISGKGVFVKQTIKKGEVVFVLKGGLRPYIMRHVYDSLAYPNWIGIDENLWIDPKKPANYLNHSCRPNMGIRGRQQMIALRDIKKDEEVTIDYSITEADKFWYMECLCEDSECRKIIKSIQTLPEDVFKRYYPYVGRYFTKVYQKSKNKK
jgi:SET domain-containing protein